MTVTNGMQVSTVANFLANRGTLDKIKGGFDILDSAANINLDRLNDDSPIGKIVVSDNGNVGASIQQLTSDATAIGKLQNANPAAPVRLAITDTVADIQAALSTLAQDASMGDDPDRQRGPHLRGLHSGFGFDAQHMS